MPVLKILNDYTNADAPEKLIDYVVRKAIFSDGFAVDLNHAAEQIHAVKSFWCETGGRQMVHFILAFDGYENVSLSNDEIYGSRRYSAVCFMVGFRSSMEYILTRGIYIFTLR